MEPVCGICGDTGYVWGKRENGICHCSEIIMDANELLEEWETGDKMIVAAMIVHDAHPNIVIDFANLLFMKYGPMATMELKGYVNEEYERSVV